MNDLAFTVLLLAGFAGCGVIAGFTNAYVTWRLNRPEPASPPRGRPHVAHVATKVPRPPDAATAIAPALPDYDVGRVTPSPYARWRRGDA